MSLDKYVIIDIEANGLLDTVDTIHCIVLRTDSEAPKVYHNGSSLGTHYDHRGGVLNGIMAICGYAQNGYTLVGHNIIGYDFPMLELLQDKYHFDPRYLDPFSNQDMIDTYVAVSLKFPEEMPGLDYWGKRLGKRKPQHEDWSTLSVEMVDRCIADVSINKRLLHHLDRHGYFEPQWEKPCDLEQKVLWIHAHQVIHGIRVDVLQANECLNELDARLEKLEKSLHSKLPKTVTVTGVEVSRPFLQDGCLSKMSRDWFAECGLSALSGVLYPPKQETFPKPIDTVRVGGPFSRITFSNVNLNSHPKVKEILLSLGWKPTAYNYKKDKKGQFTRDEQGNLIPTSPKLTEDSYDSLPPGIGQELKEFLVLKHRRRFILNENDSSKGLLSFVNDQGRVSCDAFTCGTNTGRYRHSGAFVNLPKVSSIYGQEIRSLFCVPSNRWLIGIDLKGIEAWMTAHYAYFYDGGTYRSVLETGDVHSVNAKALGCDRETAKTFLYAISYGAGAGKLASILKCSVAKAKRKIQAFWKANKGIADLVEMLESEYDHKGFIEGLDGRELYIRHKHKLLNTLIQNAATTVFKLWMVKCWEFTSGVSHVHQVLAYHDELGFEVYHYKKYQAEAMAEGLSDLATEVGIDLGLNVPIAADWKVGKKYSEVH